MKGSDPEQIPAGGSQLRAVGVQVLAFLIATALVFIAIQFGAPIVARLIEAPVPPAQMPALALAACPLPTEHEQLHIVVTNNGERLAAECMHVGSSGTYTRRRR